MNHAEKSPDCRLCDMKFEDEKKLRKHFRWTHPKNLPFQCSICHAEFDTNSAESEHFSTHVDSDNLECIICSLKLLTYKDLYFHYKQDHITKQQSICNICNKIFHNEMQLQEHKIDHKGGQRHKCVFCHKVYSSSTALSVHTKRHTNKKFYKCKTCYRAFFDISDLMKHMLFHATVLASDRFYKCGLCLMVYKQKYLLAAHIKNKHLEKCSLKPQCQICGEVLKLEMMAGHILDHSMNISTNKMSTLESEWMKQSRLTNSENVIKQGRGRPRKWCTTEMSYNSSKIQNSTDDSVKYNTRNGNKKMNDDKPKTRQTMHSGTTIVNEGNVNSSIGFRNNRTRAAKLKIKSTIVDLSDSSDEMSDNCKDEYSRAVNSNVEEITTNQVNNINSESCRIKYNTRSSYKKSNHITAASKSSLICFSDTSRKRNLNLMQSELDTPKKLNTGSPLENHMKSKHKSMSSIKATTNEFCNVDDIKIKNEKVDLNDICKKSINYRSKKKPLNEEGSIDSLKTQLNEKSKVTLDEPKTCSSKIAEDETECYIKEKKYYEPSLGLTKYSCTTCLLSFSCQSELLDHNTEHIL